MEGFILCICGHRYSRHWDGGLCHEGSGCRCDSFVATNRVDGPKSPTTLEMAIPMPTRELVAS